MLIRIYINRTESRNIFKIKTKYHLELLKLLGSTKNKIIKDKNGENVPHLEITEIILVRCNNGNNNYQQNSKVLYTLVPNETLG